MLPAGVVTSEFVAALAFPFSRVRGLGDILGPE